MVVEQCWNKSSNNGEQQTVEKNSKQKKSFTLGFVSGFTC